VSQATVKGELLTDRCSAATYIAPEYPGPDEPSLTNLNGIMLIRDQNDPEAFTEWSHKMPVNGDEWIRWYCNSTTGNFLDPGTWRITGWEAAVKIACDEQNDGAYNCDITPGGSVSIALPKNWTAERSRCDSENTTAISARLGPNRLLQIQCWEDAH
jgi:hypothetical protein